MGILLIFKYCIIYIKHIRLCVELRMENGEIKEVKGKMRVNPEFLQRGYLKKQACPERSRMEPICIVLCG